MNTHTHTEPLTLSVPVCFCQFLCVSVFLSLSLCLCVLISMCEWVLISLSVYFSLSLSLSLSVSLLLCAFPFLSLSMYLFRCVCISLPFSQNTHTHTYNAERSLNSWFESIISNKSGIIHKFVFCLAPTTSSLRIFTNSSLQLSHLSNWLFILLQLFQYQHNGTFYSYCRFCSCRLVRRLPDTSDGWRHRNPISDGSIRNHPSSAERIRPKASSG